MIFMTHNRFDTVKLAEVKIPLFQAWSCLAAWLLKLRPVSAAVEAAWRQSTVQYSTVQPTSSHGPVPV